MKNLVLKNNYRKAFFLGFLTAFCIILPYLIVDKGFFLYAGDYNSQQIPFYMYMNRMIKSGNLNWGWAVDLGSSLVNSFSFYVLGSPFFWISCLFPYKTIPYIMPWLLMLKFAVSNLGAFVYLKRYAKNDNYALTGRLLYTFSGFSVYNIFFNHFIESVVFFPWMLWALDEYMYNKTKGVFPLFVAINLVNNYFFFIGQVVFLCIYFFCKVYTKEYNFKKKSFIILCFESVLGCLMGIILFIPSAFSILNNPRVLNGLSGFGLWMYDSIQQYFAIFSSAFLPPDIPYSPAVFGDAITKWTSMSAFVAFGGMFGFFVFSKYRRNSAFYKTFVVCIVFAFVPVLNSMFYRFNSSYYARWYYMPLLMLAAMNMQSFEESSERIIAALKTTGKFTALFLIFLVTPVKNDDIWKIGLGDHPVLLRLYLLIAFLNIYTLYMTAKTYKGSAVYTKQLLSGTLYMIMLFSVVHVGITKMPQWEYNTLYKQQNYDIIYSKEFSFLSEDFNSRIDSFNCYDNVGLFINTPCIQFFNSTVSPAIMEFYPQVGVKRDVSSKPDHNLYGLRSLLSVEYILMPDHEEDNFINSTGEYSGYVKHSENHPYTVYKNLNYIPMGFCYDKYISYDVLENIPVGNRSKVLLKAIAVEKETVDKYGIDITHLTQKEIDDYSFDSFEKSVNDRKAMSSHFFKMTKDGFNCKIKQDKDNLVFFSVPYEKGFSATVNGEKTEIIKVNYGLCAVFAPEGENEINFVYRTPGLLAGGVITRTGWTVWLGYLYMIKRKRI